jgi:DNA-binding MarR family transcriptional regulator
MNDTQRFGQVLGRILELVFLLNQDMNRSFARDGLTESRAQLLWELQQRGPLTQRELADALQVSARNITGLVDGLVATGFVTREPHPTDRRATLVSFTKHGSKIAQTMREDYAELGRLLFAQMPPRQFTSFAKGLDEVVQRLREAMP